MTLRWFFLAAIAAATVPTSDVSAATAPLNCRAAHDVVSKTICGSSEYVAMDREIAALTDRAVARLSGGDMSRLAESRARYLRQRKGCAWASHHSAHPGTAIDECVRASLEERVQRLRKIVERNDND